MVFLERFREVFRSLEGFKGDILSLGSMSMVTDSLYKADQEYMEILPVGV